MKDRIKPIILHPRDSIRTAMEAIEEGKGVGAPAGIIIITEPGSDILQGVVTDGDLRRALVEGAEMDADIGNFMSENPLCIPDSIEPTRMLNYLYRELEKRDKSENTYHHLVVVDGNQQVLDVTTPFELWKRSEVRINSATVQGLGYVGLTLALTLADSGIVVHGVEKDEKKVQSLKQGQPHFFERGLKPLLQEHLGENFTVDRDLDSVSSDIHITCVNTPINNDGELDSTYLEQAVAEVGQNLDVHDLVIIRSTVVVGTCRDLIMPILEEESGLTAGEDFFFAYAPERTVAGKALEELKTLPQVIGGINQPSVEYASQIFQTFSKNVIPVSSIETAEMVKLLNNSYRDLVFSFSNETAKMCDHWGLNTYEVIQAANQGYERNQIPKPSPGVGGPCLTKDPYLLAESAERVGYNAKLPLSSRTINETMTDHVVQKVDQFCQKNVTDAEPKIFIMGMAYKGKPETSDIRNSPSVDIYEQLQKTYNNIKVFDPTVSTSKLDTLNADIVTDPAEGFNDANYVLVLTNHPMFENLDMNKLVKMMAEPSVLFDPWALYSKEEIESLSGVRYDRFSSSTPESKI